MQTKFLISFLVILFCILTIKNAWDFYYSSSNNSLNNILRKSVIELSEKNSELLEKNKNLENEIRAMQNGDKIVQLSIATSDRWKDKSSGEQREKTEWHRVVLYGKMAETASEYMRKGSMVYVEGRLRTKEWEDQNQNKLK